MSVCVDFPDAQNVPCGLYVHIPFCETKCGYCDFFSVAVKGRDTKSLVDAVNRELRRRVPESTHGIRTIFFGGGTPTILPADQLADLLDTIADVVALDRVAEFTVEANPATVDDEKAALLATRGVTRVSMGAAGCRWPEACTPRRARCVSRSAYVPSRS